jgi:hypothetical protein
MKLGTKVKLPDGRIGTVVYNSLDGVGIKWGEHEPNPKDFEGTHGGLFESEIVPDDFPWFPDAMLRTSYPSASLPCVGNDYEVL